MPSHQANLIESRYLPQIRFIPKNLIFMILQMCLPNLVYLGQNASCYTLDLFRWPCLDDFSPRYVNEDVTIPKNSIVYLVSE